jgi:hypothetical protein
LEQQKPATEPFQRKHHDEFMIIVARDWRGLVVAWQADSLEMLGRRRAGAGEPPVWEEEASDS